MKRIITLLLVAVMLVSTMVFSTNAAGTLIFSDNFDEGFLPRNWITNREACAFEWDKYNGCIQGYNDAKVLQSEYDKKNDKKWAQFYSSMDFQIRGFDDLTAEDEGRTHSISMWYRDLFENDPGAGGPQQGAVYTFNIVIETGKATLTKDHSWDYYDANNVKQSAKTNAIIAEGQIEGTIEVGERAPWYEIGMRVTSGKIECFFEQKLVFSAEVDANDSKLGDFTMNSVDASVGSQKSAILFYNGGNWVAFDNFEVRTPDYNFDDTMVYGDANKDTNVNLNDVSLILKRIAGWSDLTIDLVAADVNCDNNVNLTDASAILKVIAGWEGVVLGPTA